MTVLLWHLGAVLPATGATRRSHAWPTTRYYIWNFLDQIPALKVPETLGWRVDRLYTGIAAGLFLLSYKIIVIFPTVKAVRQGWNVRSMRRDSETKRGA